MSIDGLNVFGSLTVNGKKLSFEDFDANKDGQITEAEFTDLLSKEECDTLELSSIDNNADKIITKEEFNDFEQKVQIQEALNELQGTIAKDFTGSNAQYATQVMSELKGFATEFVANYTGTGDMVADFKAALPAKYEEIKNNVLNNTPEALAKKAEQEKKETKSTVLDNIYNALVTELSVEYPDLATEMANEICKKLQTAANEFIKNYTGTNLEADLTAHLESKINESAANKMTDATADYRAVYQSMDGGFLDENDLATLKEAATEFLLSAVEKGFIFTLKGRRCSNATQIESAIKAFTDATELNTAIENLISTLSTDSIKDSIVNTKVKEKKAAEEKAFAALKGEDIRVESETINFSGISGYYENSTVTVKKQGADGAKDDAVKLIKTHLKDQFEAQVKADLIAKGIPEDKLNTIFENVFNQSVWEAADACVSGKGGGLFSSSKSSFNIPDLVNKFIEIFNTNMANTINEMNKSSADMDLQDVDWSQAVTDENGNIDAELQAALESGTTVKIFGKGSDYYEEQANKMINRMKSTMTAKAKNMCQANNIEFNVEIFNTIFDNSRSLAVANNTSGYDAFWFSSSKITPQNLMKDFATTFESSYTTWVNGEKAKKANV